METYVKRSCGQVTHIIFNITTQIKRMRCFTTHMCFFSFLLYVHVQAQDSVSLHVMRIHGRDDWRLI